MRSTRSRVALRLAVLVASIGVYLLVALIGPAFDVGAVPVFGTATASFGGGVVLLSAALASFANGQTIAVAGATLVAYAIFQPVLRRVRHAVDRRFDRARYDAERTALAFSEWLRDETDLATVTADLAGTARSALAPTALGVWIRRGSA